MLGFALNVLFARLLGAYGTGVVLQAIAIFTIALSFARFGLDTTAVWLLPRLVVADRARVRSGVVGVLVLALAASSVVTLLWFVLRGVLPAGFGGGSVGRALTLVAVFLPAASVMTVALAATRAFGGVVPYNAIGNVLVPALRPAGLLVAVGLGGTAGAAALSWSFPWLVGAVAAVLVLGRRVMARSAEAPGRWRPERRTLREILGYSLPRTVMSGLEQAVIWLDVVLVGAIIGSTQAGVYGTASRFVSAGVIVSTALRIVVAPRFSAMLAQHRTGAVQELYSVTARWILLFGAPIYVLMAFFAPTVLGWFGPRFSSGAGAMSVLCLGCVVVLAAGNVQSLLLMSGRSALGALNKVAVVAFNVIGNLLLIPHFGIMGAAVVWAASMVLDTALAAIQVHRTTGISIAVGSIGYIAAVVLGCVGVPAAVIVLLLGQGAEPLLLSGLVGGLLLLGFCRVERNRLRMAELMEIFGVRRRA